MSTVHIQTKRWNTFKNKKLTIYMCGHISFLNRTIQTAKQLYNSIFKNIDISYNKKKKLNELLVNFDGNFAIIVEGADFLFAAVDISRTYPIYYQGKTFEDFTLLDNLPFQMIKNSGINEINLQEFYVLGIITGDKTICENIYQLQAGELLYISKNLFSLKQYFNYIPSDTPELVTNIEEFVDKFDKLLTHGFLKLKDSFPQNTNWIVPLSGGHDSRLIIHYLNKIDFKNVTCYTYGKPGNKQSEISKKIAETIGYKWHFIEYTDDKWDNLHKENVINDYINFTFNGVSNPHYQDLLAVHELKKKNLIPDSAVFLPGHSSITENGFSKENFTSIDEAISELIPKRYNDELVQQIEQNLVQHYSTFDGDAKYINANFNWREKQAKYIVNSVRVYEFFGFDFALPFWYKSVATFWLNLADKHLYNRNLLYKAEEHGLLNPILNDVPFANAELGENKLFTYKKIFKKIIPRKVIQFLLKKSNYKSDHAEALNSVFARKGKDIREVLHPVYKFPPYIQNDTSGILDRRPNQISVFNISKLYTIKKLLENKEL